MELQEQFEVENGQARSDWRTRLDAVCATLDQPAFLPWILASIVYAFVVAAWSTRPLWYDELFTHYIAKAPTLDRFISTLANFDLNPPLQAALTVLLFKFFGDSNFVARIPSMIAFWIGSYCLFRFASFRLGRFYGLTAVLVFWCTYFLRYASEARPIALMIAFFGIAILNWQQIAEGKRSGWRLVGVSIGVGGVLMSHVFGPVMLIALGLGEIVRSIAMKKIDWGVWMAFFSPAPLLFVYLPMLRAYEGYATLYPPEFQSSLGQAFGFYGGLLTSCGWPLLIAMAAAVLLGRGGTRVPSVRHEMALCAGLLAAPFFVNLLLMSQGGAFWERYCIGAGLGLGFLFAHVLARATDHGRVAGAAAVLVLLISVVIMRIVTPATEIAHRTMNPLSLQDLDAQIPFVTADGMTFLEMDQREDPTLLSHVYYLTDRSAAEHYTHATNFEVFDSLGKWFPVRAHVVRYRDFVGTSKHFLVYGTLNNPSDWLLPKLLADGAQLRFLGEMTRGYKDTLMFDVVFPK